MFLKLVDDVRDALTARFGSEVRVDEGIRAHNTQDNFGTGSANRIVFIPIEALEIIEPWRVGEFETPDDNGNVKRQLWNVTFTFDVAVAGYDSTNPDRDLAHRRKCFDIWEVLTQEVHRLYCGMYKWTAARWSLARKDGVHGAELIATLTLNIPLFDHDWATAIPAGIPGEPKPVV